MDDFECRMIRNICILAHVDHGKTTLADHLIASYGGGLLHPKLAGKVRFMDYLDEEQKRAITMKSSSLALEFRGHCINLIDSPGHVDFCSEVSAAARLSDGALVLVDAAEGVHVQTRAVLRQAWIEKLTPCLVLNKIDRLMSELKMSPMEAFTQLQRIVHEVNGIMSAFQSEKYLSDVDSRVSSSASPSTGGKHFDDEFIENDNDEEDTFQPQKGNVVFVCAVDGWGFSILDFAEFYAKKLGASSTALQRALWGPWYYNAKSKKIVGKKGIVREGMTNARPMFVQCILEPLWQVYQAALDEDGDRSILDKVIKNFELSIPPRELRNKDPKAVLQSVMSRWLPLPDTMLSMVVKHMPDPITAQSFQISRLLPERMVLENVSSTSKVLTEAELVRKAVESCDFSSDAPCVAFVSKMFAVPSKMLPQGENYSSNDSVEDSEECFLAFARVFSGVLRSRQRVFVLTTKYNPLEGGQKSWQKHVQEVEIQSLYLMMGQGLKPVASAKAGNIVAIRGLGLNILKSATLSSTKSCWPFSDMNFQVAPILKVAIEPSDPADIIVFEKGLDLLNHADPFVEINRNSKGEYILGAAGDVHLERCIQDLNDRFAKVSFKVSPPLVSFKETIYEANHLSNQLENLKSFGGCYGQFVEKTTPNGRCVIRVHVLKLPSALTKLLQDNSDLLGNIIGVNSGQITSTVEGENPIEALKKSMIDAVEISDYSYGSVEIDKDQAEKCRMLWKKLLKRIWALGPHQVGPNLLLTPDSRSKNGDKSVMIKGHPTVSEKLGFLDSCEPKDNLSDAISSVTDQSLCREAESLESSVLSGFQVATAAGPLCEEPMWGLAFVVETYVSSPVEGSGESDFCFSGQVMAAVKDGCREALRQRKPRLVESMYFCEVNTPAEQLGSANAVLKRRRARFLDNGMQEGSALFSVQAYLPVAESFGFAHELRRLTSGAASAQLVFSHWEVLKEDPFFVPKTEDELEEFGDGSSLPHKIARKLVDAVRRRKGLSVEEKMVRHATKQRNLARKV